MVDLEQGFEVCKRCVTHKLDRNSCESSYSIDLILKRALKFKNDCENALQVYITYARVWLASNKHELLNICLKINV